MDEAAEMVRRWTSVLLDLSAGSNCGGQHPLEVAAVEDQQPVETFRADGSDEALRDSVCLRRPHGSLDYPDGFAADDLVEPGGVFAVAVADQEADALVG